MYPEYFLAGLLQELGYPKTKGLIRRRKVVPIRMVDLAVMLMAKDAVCLGALRPVTATRLLMSLFDTEAWSRNDPVDTLSEFDPDPLVGASVDQKEFWSKLARLELMRPINVPNLDQMPWEAIGSQAVSGEYIGACAQSLIWGLRHPDEAIKRLNETVDDLVESKKLFSGTVLHLSGDGIGTVDELLANAESIVAEYERTRERLPENVPESLRLAVGRF